MTNPLQNLKGSLAKAAGFNTENKKKGLCVSCGEPALL